ncbi:MAG: hypothetical protein GX829_02625 [Clostridium sp.]|nr:hypothetical protein [Clostridium sp.]
MKFVKIVQSGDFHLDSPLAQHHLKFRYKRREELLDTFKNVIDFARREEADLLLLTGDLFDSKRVTNKTLHFISQSLASFQGKVFISPGNHDPYLERGIYANIDLPNNTHVFKDYEEIYLKDLDCVVCGRGFCEDFSHENMLNGVIAPVSPSIKILVMHGEVTNGKNPYNPISKESIKSSGFNYLALGHRHDFSGIIMEGETSYGYAGIPEGRGFDEQGDKGIIFGKIHSHGVNLDFKKISKRTYEQIEVDVSSCLTTSDCIKQIEPMLLKKTSIYKIKLRGSLPPYVTFDLEDIEIDLKKKLDDFTLSDETTVAVEKMNYDQRSIQQHFINAVEKKRLGSDLDEELINDVQNMGLRILSQEKF